MLGRGGGGSREESEKQWLTQVERAKDTKQHKNKMRKGGKKGRETQSVSFVVSLFKKAGR